MKTEKAEPSRIPDNDCLYTQALRSVDFVVPASVQSGPGFWKRLWGRDLSLLWHLAAQLGRDPTAAEWMALKQSRKKQDDRARAHWSAFKEAEQERLDAQRMGNPAKDTNGPE